MCPLRVSGRLFIKRYFKIRIFLTKCQTTTPPHRHAWRHSTTMSNAASRRCSIHFTSTSSTDTDIKPFCDHTHNKCLEVANVLVKHQCNQTVIAEEFIKIADSVLTASDEGYHRSCYQKFTRQDRQVLLNTV